MNRKKQKLIEIFLMTFFFLIFVIFLQLQSFIIVMLLVTSIIISLCFKNEIIKIILPPKKNSFLYFIFFDIFLVVSVTVLYGNDSFANELDFNKYFFILVLLLFYLFFSVIPQELIFRFLFFHRYTNYFNKYELLFLNSLVFSLCHVIYFDIYIFLFAFLGNLLFTFNYMKNKSLLLVISEHFLIGQTLIILGFFDNFNFSLIKKLYNLVLIN